MTEEYTVDMLTQDSVSVKKQQYYNGIELGKPHRKAYMNSEDGRQKVKDELPQEQQDAIFAVWGDTPTVTEATT